MRTRSGALFAVLLALCVTFCVVARNANTSTVAIHKRFDGVLRPRTAAAWNEYAQGHPLADGHELGFDVKDCELWRALRKAFQEADDAAKAMGY